MGAAGGAGARIDELRANGNLPSPKGVALEILRLSRAENVANSDIVHVLQADPALAGRLLRAANAAALGARRRVVSLGDAVMLLGLPVVRQLALGFSLVTQYRGGVCEGFDYQGYWTRALLCGLAAQITAGKLRVAAAEELFACGLLAQVGRLALATAMPAEYGKLLAAHADAPGVDLCRLEQQVLATDHVEVTVAMLEDWGLPPVMIGAVASHENPDSAQLEEGSRQFLLTHVLNFSAALSEISLSDNSSRVRQGPSVLRKALRLGLDAEAVETFVESLRSQWRDWAPLLDLPPVDIPPLIEPVLAEQAQTDTPADDAMVYPLRVLAVDDDRPTLEILRSLLTRAGHTVLTAANGREALAAAVKFHPQLLITDWAMPEMDGVELCRTLRASQIGQAMHMLILTGYEDEDHLVKAFDAGADDYLVKPLQARTLNARLRSAQRLLRMQDERDRHVFEMRSLASELAVNNRRLQQAATTDSLTGLPNRRYAFDRLEQEWVAARRRGSPLSCLMIDVDHFKAINDAHGHDAGDKALQHVASVLRQSARTPDSICRIGGEEFVVICPDTALPDAFKAAERLRNAVNGSSMVLNGSRIACTVSVGVAAMDGSVGSPNELLRKADQAVYHAKREGRNVTRLSRAA